MTIRSVDLSGLYQIEAVTADGLGGGTIKLVSPEAINPNWLQGDLDGVGSSLATQNITLIQTAGPTTVNLDGQYTISALTGSQITLDSPTGVSTDWNYLPQYLNGQTRPLSAALSGQAGNWIGPYIVEDPNTHFLVANVLALSGLYKDDGKNQTAFPISFEIEATPVNTLDVPVGPAQSFVGIVEGNANKTKDLRAKTLICNLTNPGRQSVRARRTTPSDYGFSGTVVDEIKWQDLYGMGPVDQPDFGNVTTVRTRTFATQGALAVKERKLNLLATRRVPIWTGGIGFSAPTATQNAAEILVQICRDPLLGNRSLEEIDIASIHDAIQAAADYFGETEAAEFNFTFDDDNTSFEEMVLAVANAVFCQSFRQGNQIKLLFEGPTEDSTLLFNHRNKVPASETRSIRFGPLDDNDGVELEYVDPVTDTPATIYIPADRSALKPRKLQAHGVRSYKQAYWLAWRSYNKLYFQHTTSQFEALAEAATTVLTERVLVADNTRADTQDGEVETQVGLVLTLSQDVDLTNPAGHTIFLQMPDATVDAIPVTAGPEANQVTLGRAPATALALDPALYARTTYQLVANDSPRSSAFLLTDKSAQDSGNYQLQAVNYTSLYYQNDSLRLWLPFLDATFDDHSAYRRDGVGAGGATTVVDGTRGKRVYSGAMGRSVGFPAFAPPAASYTKAVWFKVDDLVSDGALLESDTEFFRVTGSTLAAANFGGTTLLAAMPAAGVWHHGAVVWDEDDDRMSLYLDGELKDSVSGAGVGPRAAHQLTAFFNLKGRADDLRLINRALSASEVKELYRATRI